MASMYVFILNKFLIILAVSWQVIRSQDVVNRDEEVERTQNWTETVHNESYTSHSITTGSTNNSDNSEYIAEPNVDTLRYVAVITRHGSRSPIFTYPNDPYPYNNTKYWPDGAEELTRYGKQQLYQTGINLRKRYDGFLSKKYVPTEILVKTNTINRDFMSAACLLAGLYPPSGYQEWNPQIIWQPVPIWEDSFDVTTLATNPTLCPRYSSNMGRMVLSLDKKKEQYEHLLNYMSEKVGKKLRVHDIGIVLDTLYMQNENGYKLPEWTKPLLTEETSLIAASIFQKLFGGSREVIRLGAGPILKMLCNQLTEKADHKMKPDRRMFIEAAHDATLQALLSSFGYKSPFRIETSAYLVLELHQYENKGLFVEVMYYNNSAKTEPNNLDLPVCPSPCSLNKFTSWVKTVAPRNWKLECNYLSR